MNAPARRKVRWQCYLWCGLLVIGECATIRFGLGGHGPEWLWCCAAAPVGMATWVRRDK